MFINVHSFFDESGDPGTRTSSSDHLIFGGFATSVADEASILHTLALARSELGFSPDKVFHFAKLPHDKRLRWAEIVGGLPITSFVVVICKRGGPSGSGIQADMLYNWVARLVMERCSWYCRESGTLTSLTLEHMKGYHTEKMKSYVDRLRNLGTEIKWDHLHTPLKFGAKSTHELLQVADCIASSAGAAFQPQYGLIEPRYLRLVAPTLWKRYGQLVPYGLKVHSRTGEGCGTDHSWAMSL